MASSDSSRFKRDIQWLIAGALLGTIISFLVGVGWESHRSSIQKSAIMLASNEEAWSAIQLADKNQAADARCDAAKALLASPMLDVTDDNERSLIECTQTYCVMVEFHNQQRQLKMTREMIADNFSFPESETVRTKIDALVDKGSEHVRRSAVVLVDMLGRLECILCKSE
jgi:type IV secretory pathway VirJ component